MAISQATLDFLLTNYVTDSREWFNEHREDYRRLVVEPMAELVIALTPGMLKIDEGFITEPKIDRTISRIYKDMRIPRNRSGGRYRPNCWITFAREKKIYQGMPAYYLEITPSSYSYGMGYYQAAPETMSILREMMLAGEPQAKKAISAFERQKVFELVGEAFKRPRYPDAPEKLRKWLEKKSFSLVCESTDFELLFSENLAEVLLGQFKSIAPVYDFACAVEARRNHGQDAGEM